MKHNKEYSDDMPVCDTCLAKIDYLPYRIVSLADKTDILKIRYFHYFYPCWDLDLFFQRYTDNQIVSAAFPIGLPEWFIKLFTKDEDVVLDPFIGSGTTAIAALKLNRHYIGMEKNQLYHKYANKRINTFKKEFKTNSKSKRKLQLTI
jgi:DNA modification methylase